MTSSHPIDVEKLLADQLAAASPDLLRSLLSTFIAKDRGCTHPSCDVPGYWSEVHHIDDWAAGGQTDADKLTFACKPNHKQVGNGWQTKKLPNGRTAWIPPPHLDHGQARTNDYHHPERLFTDDDP